MAIRFVGVLDDPGQIVRHEHAPAAGFDSRQNIGFQRIADHHRPLRPVAMA